MPIPHWQAIARIGGRLVYVPQNADHPEKEYEGVVPEDPQPPLDLRVDGKAVFTLKDDRDPR